MSTEICANEVCHCPPRIINLQPFGGKGVGRRRKPRVVFLGSVSSVVQERNFGEDYLLVWCILSK